jgi:preprotein translocase subunit SecE
MNWWVRLRSFMTEVRGELKRTSWPSWKEVRGTTTVVVVTVFIFALFLWIVDIALSNMIDWVFKHAAG